MERSVCGKDYDDRPVFLVLLFLHFEQQIRLRHQIWIIGVLFDLPLLLFVDDSANRCASNLEVPHLAVVCLNQCRNGIAFAIFTWHYTRARSSTSFEVMADHTRATSRVPFFYWLAARFVNAIHNMLRGHSKLGYIVQEAIKSFRNDRQQEPIDLAALIAVITDGGFVDTVIR